MRARAEGLFSTGGRGNSAPDMSAQDAVSALLLCLQMQGPTDAPEAVKAMKELPFNFMRHDPGDGLFRDLTSDFIDPNGNALGAILPSVFGGAVPEILSDAIEQLLSHTESFQNRFDRITHEETSQGGKVTICVADADYRHGTWPEGPRAWELVFWPETLSPYDELGCWTEKRVHGEALRALRDLIRGAEQWPTAPPFSLPATRARRSFWT